LSSRHHAPDPNAPPDTVLAFAKHAANTRYEDIPQKAITAAKWSIMDTISCMLAGSRGPSALALLDVAKSWGGVPESTVSGHDVKLPAYLATMVNCGMVHQHDFDDTHDTAVCHPTSASLNGALSTAESVGGIDGKTLLAAIAIGVDIQCRLAGALRGTLWDYHWVRAPMVGIFGAAVSAGKIYKLDAEGMHNAMGLSLPQVAGTLESVTGVRSAVRTMRDGLIYKDSILAAKLASRGVRGEDRVFDGPYGLYAAYFRSDYNREFLTHELGQRFEGQGVSLKPWPFCRHTHGTITALLEALEEGDRQGKGGEVKDVLLYVGKGNEIICQKPWPTTSIDSLCNLVFAAAVCVAHRAVPLQAVEQQALNAPAVVAAAKKIRYEHEAAQERYGTIEPGHVVVTYADGRKVERAVDRALGHPSNPMSVERIRAKMEMCMGYVDLPDVKARAQKLVDTVMALENMKDVRALGDLMKR
jgi:2-methylcitrate dehydratase PrpD